MDINNETAFPESFMLGFDSQGYPQLSVILKATFRLPLNRGEQPAAAAEQLPPQAADEIFDGEITTGSVRLESDMVPFKPKTDIVLLGTARSPNGQPVKALDVMLRVGRYGKVLRVFGDRTWQFPSKLVMVPVISDPKPFQEMPLVYEKAFGGVDAKSGKWCEANLVGRGYIGKKSRESVHDKPLPNIEDPHNLISSWDSQPKPVGFGFYGRGWQPRVAFAGTFDEKWQSERAPEQPLDFRPEFYNAAHPDLQIPGYLKGDEEIELRNLTRSGHVLFKLPGLFPRMSVSKYESIPDFFAWEEVTEAEESEPTEVDEPPAMPLPTVQESLSVNLDTLVFLPDEGVFYLVWRGTCKLRDLNLEEIDKISITLERT